MDQGSNRRLAVASRWALALMASHTTLTLWSVCRPRGAALPLYETPTRLWLEPTLLLAGQTAALAGFGYLVYALRGWARELARAGSHHPFSHARMTNAAAAIVLGVCYSGGIWAATRSLIGPTGLIGWALLPAASMGLALRSTSGRTAGKGLVPSGPWVSRLRGASIVAAVTGLAVSVTSASIVGGALLPLVMLAHLPNGPPSTPDRWALESPSAGPSGDRPSMTPEAAGHAIHALLFAGSPDGPKALERTPIRRHPGWWDLQSPPTLPIPPQEWAERLYQSALGGAVDADGMAFLEGMARHPANAEFDSLGRAATADITGTRWTPLLDAPVAGFELPVPRYVELWNGVRGRIAGAVYVALRGDRDEALRRLETVEQLGWLLRQDGPLTLDGLLGAQIAGEGTRATRVLRGDMAPLPVSTGRLHTPPAGPPSFRQRLGWLQGYEATLGSADAPKGLRLEAFTLVNSFLPCASPSTVVWGIPSDHLAWQHTWAEALAARPSEADLATVLANGYLGTRAGGDGWGWLPKVLGATLADRSAVTHCAPLVAAVAGLY